jgi:hypothetical protein
MSDARLAQIASQKFTIRSVATKLERTKELCNRPTPFYIIVSAGPSTPLNISSMNLGCQYSFFMPVAVRLAQLASMTGTDGRYSVPPGTTFIDLFPKRFSHPRYIRSDEAVVIYGPKKEPLAQQSRTKEPHTEAHQSQKLTKSPKEKKKRNGDVTPAEFTSAVSHSLAYASAQKKTPSLNPWRQLAELDARISWFLNVVRSENSAIGINECWL